MFSKGFFYRWLCEIHPGFAGKVPFWWVLSRIELHLGSSCAEKQQRPGGLAEDGAVDRTLVSIKDTKSYDKLREKIQTFQTGSSWSLLGSSKKKEKKSHLISSPASGSTWGQKVSSVRAIILLSVKAVRPAEVPSPASSVWFALYSCKSVSGGA